MNSNPLIILGSARKDSDTQKLVELLFEGKEYELIDLLDYSIAQYNYEEEYPTEDEFIKVAEQMLQHEVIVFATPVYWYSMSGYMKIFFDRLTDLTASHKPIGKQLKGKRVALITVSTDDELPEGFEVPFKRTAEYFDMEYAGCFFNPSKKLSNTKAINEKASNWLKQLIAY